MNSKKLQAFTITEISVTMVISGILITLAVGLYLNIQKLYGDTISKNDSHNEILYLQSMIKNDFENAQEIYEMNAGIEIITQKNKYIYYEFNSDFTTRSRDIAIDTFFVASDNLYIETMEESDNLVSMLTLDIFNDSMFYPITLRKEYSRSILFNYYYKED